MSKHSHVKDYMGRYVAPHQAQMHRDTSKHDWVNVPPDTQGSFGSKLIYNFKEKNGKIKSATLELKLSALTKGAGSSYARYTPSTNMISKIEIEINGNVISTLYPEEQYNTQMLIRDPTATAYFKKLIGDDTTANRNSLANGIQTLYLPIHSLLDVSQMFIPDFLTSDIRFNVYLAPIVDCTEYDGSAPSGTVLSSSLKVKFEKLHETGDALAMREAHLKVPHHYPYLEPVLMRGEQVVAGSSTITVPLRSIIGPVSWIYFIIRDPDAKGDEAFIYKSLESFEILDSANHNITGRQQITDIQNRYLLAHDVFPSTFTTEKNIYWWSFSEKPVVSTLKGSDHGGHIFTGNEKLVIRFPTALASNVQVDIVAFCNATLVSGPANQLRTVRNPIR